MNSWTSLDPGVDVPVVELPVEVEEDGVVIDVGGHLLSLRPWGRLERVDLIEEKL